MPAPRIVPAPGAPPQPPAARASASSRQALTSSVDPDASDDAPTVWDELPTGFAPRPHVPSRPDMPPPSGRTPTTVLPEPRASTNERVSAVNGAVASRMSGNKWCPTCGGKYPDDFNVCPRDATPLDWSGARDEDPYLGATLADTYRVARVLGEGGMGRVYEVHHARLPHRRFALKMLHSEYARQNDIVQRFQREAEATSRVKHDNVIDVFDVGRTPDGRPYLVSELLEGDDLGAVLKRQNKLEVGLAVHVVRQVCGALAAAHKFNVVHRDMKPENLFIVGEAGGRPHVKVLDFGISKMGNYEGTHLTRTGVIMGTPAYMAPEQARGERVDHRVDVYAVGAILYRLLTGRTPFAIDDPSAALTAVLTQNPPRPRSLAAEIPEALEMVIERAMSKKPNERFASMDEFDAALAPFDLPSPTVVPTATPSGRQMNVSAGSTLQGVTSELGRGRSAIVARATREAQLARPALVVVSLLAGVASVVGLTDAIASAVVLVARQTTLGKLSSMMVLVGVIAATLTPFVLYARYLARTVWGSTVLAIRFAQRLQGAFLVAMATYGAVVLSVRFLEGVVYQTPAEVSWPGWSVAAFLTAVLAAGGSLLFARFGERR